MAIRVSTGTAQAGVTLTRPRVGVVLVAPAAGITYTLPVSQIDHIQLSASLVLDNTGYYKYIVDATAVVDGVSLLLAKSFDDGVRAVDVAKVTPQKGLSDSISFQEVVVRTLVFIRNLEEAVVAQDRPRLHLSRPASDILALSDTVRQAVIKASRDAIVAADFVARSTGKSIAESIADVQDKAVADVSKALKDGAIASDAVARIVVKALRESLSMSDARILSISKRLADGVGMSDNADVADGLVTQVAKTVANVAFVSDVAALSVTRKSYDAVSAGDSKSILLSRPRADQISLADVTTRSAAKALFDSQTLADSMARSVSKRLSDFFGFTDTATRTPAKYLSDTQSLADAGLLYSQGYCDITFFATDYVGEARTF